jgi:hypothetical protein
MCRADQPRVISHGVMCIPINPKKTKSDGEIATGGRLGCRWESDSTSVRYRTSHARYQIPVIRPHTICTNTFCTFKIHPHHQTLNLHPTEHFLMFAGTKQGLHWVAEMKISFTFINDVQITPNPLFRTVRKIASSEGQNLAWQLKNPIQQNLRPVIFPCHGCGRELKQESCRSANRVQKSSHKELVCTILTIGSRVQRFSLSTKSVG